MNRPLADLRLAVMMLDGIELHGRTNDATPASAARSPGPDPGTTAPPAPANRSCPSCKPTAPTLSLAARRRSTPPTRARRARHARTWRRSSTR
jgi:hypothetical protein